MTEQTKRCGMCRQHKPRSEFHRATGQADGLQHRCKPCMRKSANRAYRRRLGKTCSACGVMKLPSAFDRPREMQPVCRQCDESLEVQLAPPKPKRVRFARPGRTDAESDALNDAAIDQIEANTAAALGR